MSETAAITREAEAASVLIANMRDILAGDEDLKHATIEGETGLVEALAAAAERIAEIEALAEASKGIAQRLASRMARLDAQAERLRAATLNAMSQVDMAKLELPLATLSVKRTSPKVEIINEADIPSWFWKPQAPKLSKADLAKALKDGKQVPGAILSNGSVTLSILPR